MAVLAADRNTQSKDADLKSYPAAVDIIYKGAMVVVNSAGYLAPAADAQGNTRVVGVADEKVDNSGGSAGDKTCRVRSGRAFRFVATAIDQADVGMNMYVVDDQTFDDGRGTNGVPAGVLVEFVSSTSGWIFIPTPGGGGKGIIPLDLASARLIASNDIDTLANHGGIVATNSTPTYERINGATDKNLQMLWAAGNVDAVQFAPVPLPPDLDETHDISVHFYAEMGGATDTPVITVAAFFNVGDADAGGNTAALANAVGEVFRDIAAADVAAHPGVLGIEIVPGTHGTDTVILYAAWIEYSKRPF